MSHLCQKELSLNKKKSTTEIKGITVPESILSSASERSERKGGTICFLLIQYEIDEVYYITVRVYSFLLLAIISSLYCTMKDRKRKFPL